jgi:TM2 domain-containing membrane protein YozV
MIAISSDKARNRRNNRKEPSVKTASAAFVFWLLGFVGLCGLHRFYVGRNWTGLLWLFTFGLLGVGQLFDLFFLGSMVRQANILQGLAMQSGTANINTNTVAPVFNITVQTPGQTG